MKSRRIESASEADALEELHQRGLTDGLPVVIPTLERVRAMILGGGMDADMVLGIVGPSDAEATVEKAAINAVMAGCLPDHFPVVIAAIRAACQEVFDLGTHQSTTHPITPIMIVNGPAREACGGIASGCGALGPGYRANAAIGRALRFVMTNVGGARAGISDMAVLGQPAKFTACLAEAEEKSPWAPLSESRGFAKGQSAVTLVAVDGPHSVIATTDGDDPEGPERIARVLAGSIATPGANNTYSGKGSPLVIINPNHAHTLAKRFPTREALQQRLFELAVTPLGVLRTHASRRLPEGAPDTLIRAVEAPEQLIIIVAGSEGVYSAVCNSWSGGAHGVQPVSQGIELNQYCELPAARVVR